MTGAPTELGQFVGSVCALGSGLWGMATADARSLVFAVLGMVTSVAVPWGVAWINRSAALIASNLKVAGLEQRVRELEADLKAARDRTPPQR